MNKYKSNMFRFTVDDMEFYHAPLTVNEPVAWRALQGRELETGPYHIGHDKAYFTDNAAANSSRLQAIIDMEKIQKKKVGKVDNDATARIVGSLLYKAFHIFFLQLNFQCHFKGLYYKKTDYYVKSLVRDEGKYLAFRGIAPKVYARDQVLFFQTNSEYRIEIDDLKQYKMWAGFHVKIYNEKGYFVLKEADPDNEEAKLAQQEREVVVSLESIYIPATSMVLGRRGVLTELQMFSQFRDPGAHSEYAFIDRACEDLGVRDIFRLPLDKSEMQTIPFVRCNFKEA